MSKTKSGTASRRLARLFHDYDKAKEALDRLLAEGIPAKLDRHGSSWRLLVEASYAVARSTDCGVPDVVVRDLHV